MSGRDDAAHAERGRRRVRRIRLLPPWLAYVVADLLTAFVVESLDPDATHIVWHVLLSMSVGFNAACVWGYQREQLRQRLREPRALEGVARVPVVCIAPNGDAVYGHAQYIGTSEGHDISDIRNLEGEPITVYDGCTLLTGIPMVEGDDS